MYMLKLTLCKTLQYTLIPSIYLASLFNNNAYAEKCYLTLAKSNCWYDYTLNVNVEDVQTRNLIAKILVPANKAWSRVEFQCHSKQTFNYTAHYTPIIWDNDKDTLYHAKRYWNIPTTTDKNTTWEIKVCFGDDFSGVTRPPKTFGKCSCDFTNIPAVEP